MTGVEAAVFTIRSLAGDSRWPISLPEKPVETSEANELVYIDEPVKQDH